MTGRAKFRQTGSRTLSHRLQQVPPTGGPFVREEFEYSILRSKDYDQRTETLQALVKGWNTPAPDAPCKYAGDRSRDRAPGACMRAQSTAPSVMPGVVFSGTMEGDFFALDAWTGKVLWRFQTGGEIWANPISYRSEGKQYIAVAAGSSMMVFGLP